MDADWPKPDEEGDECHIRVHESTVSINRKVSIYCWQHLCWANSSFRDNSEAYGFFRCDHGQKLRFLLIDTNPVRNDALPPVFADLTDVVYDFTHNLEERAYATGNEVDWALYVIRTNEVGVPELHQCKVRMVDSGSWDENDYKGVSYVVDDENGRMLTHFSITIDGRA